MCKPLILFVRTVSAHGPRTVRTVTCKPLKSFMRTDVLATPHTPYALSRPQPGCASAKHPRQWVTGNTQKE